VVQSGAIGKIKEVHSWSGKKWGDDQPLPETSDPVPPTLNWDVWLGVCAERPYIDKYYHPGIWRKRLDFGTGTFGDMGCHIFDPVFWALALTAPISVRSEGPAPNRWNWATNALIHYVFPGTQYTEGKTVPIHWYDGDTRPPADIQALVGPKKVPSQGSIFIGTKGVVLLEHVGRPVLFPEAQFKDYQLPHDAGTSHNNQFIDAVLGKDKTTAAFDYAGPLTESVLLGGVSTHFPNQTLEWDAKALKFTNFADADRLLRRAYRKGYEKYLT
jgi:predicted dehydrogenase